MLLQVRKSHNTFKFRKAENDSDLLIKDIKNFKKVTVLKPSTWTEEDIQNMVSYLSEMKIRVKVIFNERGTLEKKDDNG